MTTIRPRVLQKGPLMPALEARLNERYDVQALWQQADAAAFLEARGGEFSGLVTSAAIGADAALIEKLPALRVISSFGVGIDKLDLDTARRNGVAVGYTPDVLNVVQRRIAGAALDVFDNEPHVPRALLELEHVVLLPHIASGTKETRKAMADLVLANLAGFYADGKLVTPAPMPA